MRSELQPESGAHHLGVPPGRHVELDGRGRTFYREQPGPPGSPTVLLLHGLLASASLNWRHAFGPLSEHFNVVAPDLRGHARGLETRRRFRLEDCADDVAALLDVLGCGRVIAAGWSLGGPVAKLLWRRHPDRVAGLVLCATQERWVPESRRRMFHGATARILGTTGRAAQIVSSRRTRDTPRPDATPRLPRTWGGWGLAEMRRHDPWMAMQAVSAVLRFDASGWLHEIDVPTSVLVTARDRAVPARNQLRMAGRIPGATLHNAPGGHAVCNHPNVSEPLLRACRCVGERL
jgi:pimeloyl-ACP methyl ester carboxylesterase